MRGRLILVCAILYCMFFICGCQSLVEQYDHYVACKNDPDCMAIVNDVNSQVDRVTSGAVGSIVGMITSLGLAVYLGRKKKRGK
jgi:hypothetical protein